VLSDEQLIAEVERITGYRFARPDLVRQAFVHASAAPTPGESNERLEFLGDAALGFVACEMLYESLSHLPEGELTKIKSLIVSRAVCAQIAEELDLCAMLSVGKGMNASALPQSVKAAVLESVLGAILIEAGIDPVRQFVRRLLEPQVQRACKAGHHRNFKSVLQQVSQLRGEGNPCYRLLDERGPDHDKAFEVAVEMGAVRYAPRWARSKREAEQAAAEATLRALGIVVDSPEGEPEVDWSAMPVAPDEGDQGSNPDGEDNHRMMSDDTSSTGPEASAA